MLSRLYYNQSFQNRIRTTFIILIVLAVSLTGWGSYWIASDIVQKNAARSAQNTINKAEQVLDERLRHIAVSVMTIMISDAFKGILRDAAVGEASGYAKHLSLIQPVFGQIKLNEPLTHSVLITTPIGDFYDTGFVRNARTPFKNSDMHRLVQEQGVNQWFPAHPDPYFAGNDRVVSLVIAPTTDTPVPDLYIVVNVLEKSLIDVMRRNVNDTDGAMVLVDPQGRPIVASASALWDGAARADFPRIRHNVQAGLQEAVHAASGYIYNYAPLTMREGWMLISIQEKSALLGELGRILRIVLLVAAGCIAVALLISRALMSFLMKPIQALRSLMRRVENNELNVRYESRFSDEFTYVGNRFNRMLDQITALIETNKTIEADKRHAEMIALQAQISPHFLYNTLNTIYWRSQLGQNEDVGEMVLSLSRLFQLGLNEGREMTTLGKELTHVEQYLLLQQRCYENLFDYRIEVEDERLLDMPFLKLVLQPLAENAILHGFEDRSSGGDITIRVQRDGGTLLAVVRDNGRGMEADRLAALNVSLGDSADAQPPDKIKKRRSYALRNIHNRLQLYYGSAAALAFESVPGEGTTATLRVPIEGEDDD